jgi:hypothetical protein
MLNADAYVWRLIRLKSQSSYYVRFFRVNAPSPPSPESMSHTAAGRGTGVAFQATMWVPAPSALPSAKDTLN